MIKLRLRTGLLFQNGTRTFKDKCPVSKQRRLMICSVHTDCCNPAMTWFTVILPSFCVYICIIRSETCESPGIFSKCHISRQESEPIVSPPPLSGICPQALSRDFFPPPPLHRLPPAVFLVEPHGSSCPSGIQIWTTCIFVSQKNWRHISYLA